MMTVYILYSLQIDSYYIGQTDEIERRLISHNSGLSSYTSRANDWKLVYSEGYETRTEARKRENEIKRKKSRKYLEGLVFGQIKKGNSFG